MCSFGSGGDVDDPDGDNGWENEARDADTMAIGVSVMTVLLIAIERMNMVILYLQKQL